MKRSRITALQRTLVFGCLASEELVTFVQRRLLDCAWITGNPPKERFSVLWGQANLLYFADRATSGKRQLWCEFPSA